MPVASTDLIWYLSANRPEDDTSTSGGATAVYRAVKWVLKQLTKDKPVPEG